MDAANLERLYPVFLEAKPKPLTDHEKIKTNKQILHYCLTNC